jgi:hypothetical protein
MTLELLQVQDRAAESRLVKVLEEALRVLGTLDASPVLVAECPWKFNDAWYDDHWLGVQVGSDFWEEAQYFKEVKEPFSKENGRNTSTSGIATARTVLKSLQSAGWRAEFQRCFGERFLRSGDVICLGIQSGQPWLCVASSNGETEIACTISPRAYGLVHMARCDRFDQSLGEAFPLRFSQPRPEFGSFLTPEARAYYFPEVRDAAASKELCTLLRNAVARIEAATGTTNQPVVLWSKDSFGNQYAPSPPRLLWGDAMAFGGETLDNPALQQLYTVMEHLESADWRGLFERSMGTFEPYDSVCLIRQPGSAPMLVWELTAFEFQSDRLSVLGLYDRATPARWKFDIQPMPLQTGV